MCSDKWLQSLITGSAGSTSMYTYRRHPRQFTEHHTQRECLQNEGSWTNDDNSVTSEGTLKLRTRQCRRQVPIRLDSAMARNTPRTKENTGNGSKTIDSTAEELLEKARTSRLTAPDHLHDPFRAYQPPYAAYYHHTSHYPAPCDYSQLPR